MSNPAANQPAAPSLADALDSAFAEQMRSVGRKMHEMVEQARRLVRFSGAIDAAVKLLGDAIWENDPPKRNGATSRAGQRQAAERRAMYGGRS